MGPYVAALHARGAQSLSLLLDTSDFVEARSNENRITELIRAVKSK